VCTTGCTVREQCLDHAATNVFDFGGRDLPAAPRAAPTIQSGPSSPVRICPTATAAGADGEAPEAPDETFRRVLRDY
jgi:hypothetical protein